VVTQTQAVCKQSDESFLAVAAGVRSHLKKLRQKGVMSLPRQGLALVHFSAQPEPFLTQNTPETTPVNP
jgi:hypothetical protein